MPRCVQVDSTRKWIAHPRRLPSTPSGVRLDLDDLDILIGQHRRLELRGRGGVVAVGGPRPPESPPQLRQLHLGSGAHLHMVASRNEPLEIGHILASRQIPDEDPAHVTVVFEGKEERPVPDLLRRFLANEEMPLALDDLDQALVGILLRVEAFDSVEKLVVRETQPALRERLVVGPLPGSATLVLVACIGALGHVVGVVHGCQV